MSKRLFLTALAVILVGDLAASLSAQQPGRSRLEPEEHAAHAALLDSILSRVTADVVMLDTVSLVDAGEARRLSLNDGDVAEALRDYTAKNGESYLLEEEPASRFRLIRPARSEGPGACPCLRIALSRVGFNGPRDRALVRVRYEEGGRWKDQYVMLKKGGEKWEVERRLVRLVR